MNIFQELWDNLFVQVKCKDIKKMNRKRKISFLT